jgi:hypothetical protein
LKQTFSHGNETSACIRGTGRNFFLWEKLKAMRIRDSGRHPYIQHPEKVIGWVRVQRNVIALGYSVLVASGSGCTFRFMCYLATCMEISTRTINQQVESQNLCRFVLLINVF